MYAFGLAECGDYRAAERYGRAALAANARDAWAAHAVLHVFEMEGRQADGLAFVAETARDWGPSYFAGHNWWHSGLYRLELGQLRHALAVYDDCVAAQGLATPLGRADAASLLWRLWLHGADIGERPGALADAFEGTLSDSAHCFNDWHAVMALALAGRLETAYGLTAELATRASGTNKVMLERAGLDVILGVIAFARGQYPSAVKLLGQGRRHAGVIGGSHAQRDAIDLTLLAAAAARPATAPWSGHWSPSGWPASRPPGARPGWSSRPARPGPRRGRHAPVRSSRCSVRWRRPPRESARRSSGWPGKGSSARCWPIGRAHQRWP